MNRIVFHCVRGLLTAACLLTSANISLAADGDALARFCEKDTTDTEALELFKKLPAIKRLCPQNDVKTQHRGTEMLRYRN